MAEPLESFPSLLSALLDGQEVPNLADWFGQLLDGTFDAAQAAAFLVALRGRGETADDLTAGALALRTRMVRFDANRTDAIDTCGTGGDGSGTFNISTAAAFVVAAAGVPVVKHGNRAVSSTTGSSDVLRALGLAVDAGPLWAKRCLDTAGLAFLFAPDYHPALVRLAPVRKALGIRTIFNALGPLANPALPSYQLLGVGRLPLLDPMSQALAKLGVRRALVVCGRDGFDEVSLNATTDVRVVADGRVESTTWTRDDFGLPRVAPADIQAADAAASAAIIEAVLANRDGPHRHIVIANAAAALMAAARCETPRQGMALADTALSSGRALEVVRQMRACSP